MSDHKNYCRVNYWINKDGRQTSCSCNDEWDICEVAPLSTYSGYGTQTFRKDDTGGNVEYKIGELVSLLNQAFKAGIRYKTAEVKKVLGV